MSLPYDAEGCEEAKKLLIEHGVRGSKRLTGFEVVWLANQLIEKEGISNETE